MTDQELTTGQPGTAVGAHTGGDSRSMLQIIAEAASNPQVDAQKMTTLADLALRLKDHEKQEQFNRDKVAALLEMPMISKKGKIVIPGKDGAADRVQGRFAKFEDIMRVVVPILARHNLAISFKAGHEGQLVTVAPILSHRNGYTEVGEQMLFPIDSSGSKNNTQGVGSSASYGKRQATKACLNIIEIGEDDDGYGAGGHQLELDADQQAIVDAGSKAAQAGKESFTQWFDALPPDQRGWLVISGQFDKLDPEAVQDRAAVQAEKAQETWDRAGEMRGTKRTPAQMVDAYAERTTQAATLDELQEFQAEERTQTFVQRIKKTDPTLFDRITTANAAAYERLSGN